MKFLKRISIKFLKYLQFIPYSIIDLFAINKQKESSAEDILIIKLDEIGDYILFRNLLPHIHKLKKQRDNKIVLCGNIVWKELSETIDIDFIDEFIWIEKGKFNFNLIYRYKILKKINSQHFSLVLNFSHSRKYFLDDNIVKASNSYHKYGTYSDLANMYSWQKKISDKFYKIIIDTSSVRFEFLKNKIFVENILNKEINLSRPFIAYKSNSFLKVSQKYVIISLGARFKHKRWNEKKFASVAAYLSKNYSIVLAGSKKDQNYLSSFKSVFDNFINFVGKTSLLDLINLVANSELVISNDTGIVHIAGALDVKTVVIHNGTHYGRFLPYPSKLGIPIKVVHPLIMQNLAESEKEEKFFYRSYLDINKISPDQVISTIKSFKTEFFDIGY